MADRVVRHFVAVTAVAAVAGYIWIYTRLDVPAAIRSDGYSYYVYLPSWFIYKDVSLAALARDWYGGTYPDFTAIRQWPATGRWLNPHPIGVAILMTPFFLAAHALSWWSNFPQDGFSLYYQHGAGLAGLAYLLIGLALLRAILRPRFSSGVVLATLVSITWGTNLFHYGVFDSTFSHAFSFCLICAWLFVVERWWADSTRRRSAALGAIGALLMLTRHTNALFLIVLPLYGVTRWRDLRSRLGELWDRRRGLALAMCVGVAGMMPQLALYKSITGAWAISPYGALDVGFTFARPHIVGVLFSTQKGLFFWSPVLLLAVAGLFVANRWTRQFTVAAIVLFAVDTYLIASWGDWQFGGSYGHRAFTDGLGLAAPFLGSSFEWAAARERAPRAVGMAVAATCAVLLSIAQMIQYWLRIIPFGNTTWAQYRDVFLRFH